MSKIQKNGTWCKKVSLYTEQWVIHNSMRNHPPRYSMVVMVAKESTFIAETESQKKHHKEAMKPHSSCNWETYFRWVYLFMLVIIGMN